MPPSALLIALAFAAAPAAATASLPPARCDGIMPPASLDGAQERSLLPEDLARLRDIGPVDPFPHAQPFFTVSPDRRRAAFQLRRADPDANSYCLAMAVLDLETGAKPVLVDRGGEVILLTVDMRGLADFPVGVASVITPRWSLDGSWIAFLKREAGTTQVWRAAADGSGSAQLTHASSDVVDFRFGVDGTTIIFATRPALDLARAEIEQEGLTGYHYDERFSPVLGVRPFALAPVEREVEVLELVTGRVRPALPDETVAVADPADLVATAGAPARGNHPQLSISATTLTGGAERGSLHARRANGLSFSCTAPECEGAVKPWWMPDRRRVRFFRQEGWAGTETAIYEWIPRSGSVRRLYSTEDVLASCTPAGESLLCLRESSLQPRRLERLNPASGARELLFDPNPEFAGLKLGSVERLRWKNRYGLEAIGDLVFPVGYREGERYPLVVVQYDTRGFLRGGTGDDYPIQAFANRGYAVLSVRRPPAIGLALGARDFAEARRLNLENFADRRSAFSSIEAGVGMTIERGVADPARLGITGLSDGATATISALIHSSLFSAAAISSCCIDTTLAMRVGPTAAREFQATGYPGLLERDSPFWQDISLSVNARRIRTPLLLQVPDNEFLSGLETYAALREAGAPVDMFVFPNEHHVKWQPAHRLATYRRSLDWFDFWLRGIRSDAPERQRELRHWDTLMEGLSAPSPS